jgi:hypothetical protein
MRVPWQLGSQKREPAAVTAMGPTRRRGVLASGARCDEARACRVDGSTAPRDPRDQAVAPRVSRSQKFAGNCHHDLRKVSLIGEQWINLGLSGKSLSFHANRLVTRFIIPVTWILNRCVSQESGPSVSGECWAGSFHQELGASLSFTESREDGLPRSRPEHISETLINCQDHFWRLPDRFSIHRCKSL